MDLDQGVADPASEDMEVASQKELGVQVNAKPRWKQYLARDTHNDSH